MCSNYNNIFARLQRAGAPCSCYTLLVNRLEYFSIKRLVPYLLCTATSLSLQKNIAIPLAEYTQVSRTHERQSNEHLPLRYCVCFYFLYHMAQLLLFPPPLPSCELSVLPLSLRLHQELLLQELCLQCTQWYTEI